MVVRVVLALAGAGLAARKLLDDTRAKANPQQRKELEAAVAKADAREREEQRIVKLAEESKEKTARMSREATKALEECTGYDLTPEPEDKRIPVEVDQIEEAAKGVLPGPVRTGIDFVEKFGEKMSNVVDSPEEIETKIQQRTTESQAETGASPESARTQAEIEYSDRRESFRRFSEAMEDTKHAGVDAGTETAEETVQKKVVKKAIKNVQPPRK